MEIWILTLGILFIVLAIVLMLPGFSGGSPRRLGNGWSSSSSSSPSSRGSPPCS